MADLNEIFGSDSEAEEVENEQQNASAEVDSDNQEAEGSHDGNNENQESDENQEETNEQASENNEQEESNKSGNDEDSDNEVISRKREKKNDVDVFGEELSDLSDDSDVKKTADSDKEEENEDEDEDNDQSGIVHKEPEEVEEEEAEPEQIINIEIPRVKTDLGKESHFVKLPNFLSVEPRPFDPETYEDDLLEKSETVDEEGQARVRLKVENTIRWRYEKDSEGNLVKQSNAKIVKWSDGSLSMYLGNEIFDVYKTFMQGDHNHLFVRQGNVLHGQTIFKTKLAFRPHSTDSMTHRKMTMSIVDRTSKLKKVKILTEIKKNPENNRNELMKKEEEKLKAASRRQNQQRRIREKSHTKGLSTNYLEDKYDSDDGDTGGVSLSAIKNKFKSRKEVYSSSDESENERRLNRAKQNEDEESSSDGEDDIYSKKSSSTKKKKVKHVVSDDDED